MNRLQRIYALHWLFRSHKLPISRTYIQQKLECSASTVKRIIAEMRDFLGAPIVYERTAGGYRYAELSPNFELPGFWFNESELSALLSAIQFLESTQPGLLQQPLQGMLKRLRLLIQDAGLNMDDLTRRILLHPMRSRPVRPEVFEAVATSLMRACKLLIVHQSPQKQAPDQRSVHPFRLLRYRDAWYLISHCDRAGERRTFALDRILKAQPLSETAQPPDNTALDTLLRESFGIFLGSHKHTAVLRFKGLAAQWVANEMWHPEQVGSWQNEGYELHLPYGDERELVMEILKYGPDIEVVAPQGLFQAVREKILAAAKNYE